MAFPFFSPSSPSLPPTPDSSPLFISAPPAAFNMPAGGPRVSERDRLGALDQMHSIVLEPYHSAVIGAHLAKIHATGRRSAVLDLGSGTGARATAIANAQPFADVDAAAFDWAAYGEEEIDNGNLDFSTVEVTAPFPWPSRSFDVIQVKGWARCTRSYTGLVERLARLLRPGGLLVLVEEGIAYESASGGVLPTCLRRWEACVREALGAKTVDVEAPATLLSKVRSAGVFAPSAYTQDLGMPVGGYMRRESPTLGAAGDIHARILSANFHALLPDLLSYGYSRAHLEALVEECIEELLSGERYLQRLRAVYAVKLG
ncbi:hypothetical protein IAT38_001215 [Cryptococcus sp. DSM 104549]